MTGRSGRARLSVDLYERGFNVCSLIPVTNWFLSFLCPMATLISSGQTTIGTPGYLNVGTKSKGGYG